MMKTIMLSLKNHDMKFQPVIFLWPAFRWFFGQKSGDVSSQPIEKEEKEHNAIKKNNIISFPKI